MTLTTDQLDLLREAHYEGSAYLIAGPQNVVFAARVNGNPAGNDYAEIGYDTVTIGDYTDLIVDMDLRISRTNDVRKSYFSGRVRKTPTSAILYINQTSATIVDNDYIFVVNSYPIKKRDRYKTFVDRDRPYEPLPPIESNVDSAYAVLTRGATAEFSLESIGQAIEDGATIAGVEWNIPDATYTVGSSTDEVITFEVDTPYNNWGHLTLTDSNGTTNTLHFTITAGDPDNEDHDFFRKCYDDGIPVSSDWDNGFSASAIYWDGISDLLDNTRVTLVSYETFDGESLGVGNIQFVGYFNASVSSTSGDEIHAQRKEAQLTFSGLMQLAGRVRFNQMAIQHSASPTAWGWIKKPSIPRNIVHEFAHHSTFLNLVSMNFAGIGSTYLTGNTNIEDRSLTDAARKAAREIVAHLVQDAAGKVKLVRNPSAADNAYRTSIPDKTPEPIDLGDVKSWEMPHTSTEDVGWLDGGFRVIHPTTLVQTSITSNAPASGPGDGSEDDVEGSQLLASTSNLSLAIAEARQRTGDLYEMANNNVQMRVNFGSGWGGVVRATPGEYYQFFVDTTDDVRGNGVNPDDNWLCLSVETTINRDGTQDTNGTFIKVTQGTNALIAASISPAVVNTPLPVLPVISPYPAIPMPASVNYDTANPTNKIPRDPFSGMQTLPIPTEDAAAAAQNQPNPNEARAFTYFNYANNVTMGFTTVLGEDYTLVASGSAQISGDGWTQPFDMTTGLNGWVFQTDDNGADIGSLNLGVGIEAEDNEIGGTFARSISIILSDTVPIGTLVSTKFDITKGAFSNPTQPAFVIEVDGGLAYALLPAAVPDGTNIVINHTLAAAATTSIRIGIAANFQVTPVFTGSVLLKTITFSGEGTNPFTGDPGVELHGDALYQFEKDDEGKPINVMAHAGRGLYIDDMAIGGTLPPFNENHEYTLDLADFNGGIGGTGNAIQFRFNDDTYADNERLPLNLVVTGPGAGS